MPSCAVKSCKNRTSLHRKKDGITFHCFPRDPVLKKKWKQIVQILRKENDFIPSSRSVICCKHFNQRDLYTTKKGFTRLKKDACPSLKVAAANKPVHPSTSKELGRADSHLVAIPSSFSVQETILPIENIFAKETHNTVIDVKEEPIQKWDEYESFPEESSSDAFGVERVQPQVTDVPMVAAIKQEPKNVLIGVTGSVATIKLPLLIETIVRLCGHTVSIKVVSTENAFHFFNESELPVYQRLPVKVHRDAEEWSAWIQRDDPVLHIDLTKWADLFLIAPLDANTLGKLAQGLCDNLLTCVARAWPSKKPLVFCPAMNTQMWEHPVTAKQISRLKRWGMVEVPCVSKTLACGDTGMGAMAEVDTIASVVKKILSEDSFKAV